MKLGSLMNVRAAITGSLIVLCLAAPAIADSMSPLDFVNLYLDQIFATDHLLQQGQEHSAGGKFDPAACVHDMAALQIEFATQAAIMRRITLAGEAKGYPAELGDAWDLKSKLYEDFATACEAFMAGHKRGVDYGGVAAKLPRIRALSEAADRTVLATSPLVFALLIDERADREGHASHLTITNRERSELIRSIDSRFGAELKRKDMPTLVTSVAVLRDYLTEKGFKGSDDPW